MSKKTDTTSGTKKWKTSVDINTDFNRFIGSLNTAGLQQKQNALYQVLYQIITSLQNQQTKIVTKFQEVADVILDIGDTIINTVNGLKDATFWTKNDETLFLPSSFRVVAGTGIVLDYSVANQVTVSSNGGSGVLYMIIGEPPQIMSDGVGNGIVLPFELPVEIP